MKTKSARTFSMLILLCTTPILASADDTFCAAYKGNTQKTEQYGLCHSYCEVKNCYDSALRKGSQTSCDSILTAYVKKFQESPPCLNNNQHPAISVDKRTNGVKSNATSTTPLLLLVDSPITWTYTVTNTGDTTVTVNSVNDLGSDNSQPTVTCNPALPTSLAATAHLTCTATGTALEGPYSNEVTVSATANGSTLTATDQGAYLGLKPGLAVYKLAEAQTVEPGQPLTWQITVQNTGQFVLTNITYNDSEPTADVSVCPTTLQPGTFQSCNIQVNAPGTIGNWTNTVNVTAHYTDGLGQDYTIAGSASATTTVIAPQRPPAYLCPCVKIGTTGTGTGTWNTAPNSYRYKSVFSLVPGEITSCQIASPTQNNYTFIASGGNATSGDNYSYSIQTFAGAGFTNCVTSLGNGSQADTYLGNVGLTEINACAGIIEQHTGVICTGP